MKFNKFLSIAITSLSALCANNISNASVICSFYPDAKCFVECDGIKREFNSITELSNNINSIASKYFTVNSVTYNPYCEQISFNNFNNCGVSNGYQLIFRGTKYFLPNIKLNYDNNDVIFPKINLEYIKHLYINSNIVNELPKLRITEDQDDLEMNLDDEIVYCLTF